MENVALVTPQKGKESTIRTANPLLLGFSGATRPDVRRSWSVLTAPADPWDLDVASKTEGKVLFCQSDPLFKVLPETNQHQATGWHVNQLPKPSSSPRAVRT